MPQNGPDRPGEDTSSRRRFLKLALALGGAAAAAAAGVSLAGRLVRPGGETGKPGSCSDYLAAFAQNAVSGGPPKDGIPSIDAPRFMSSAEADDFLEPTDVVFGVDRGGVVRAYPQRILVWHEIVNDVLGGQRVAVTYCPLTGSPVGYLPPRDAPGETFGVSGNLVNNNLIMYDRVTDSRWPQVLGTAYDGTRCNAPLETFPVVWTTWDRWRDRHPETEVLTTDTGFVRNYSRDPYGVYNPDPGGYYSQEGTFFPNMRTSDRFPMKKPVLGVKAGGEHLAIPHAEFRSVGVRNLELGGVPVVALYDGGLDAIRVFRREVEGSVLRFTQDGEGFLDEDTGTRWAADGIALEGPLQGAELATATAFTVMWFAWFAFFPETRVLEV